MKPQEKIVADDWTRNWQANIAVKISSVVLWVASLFMFITLVIVIWDKEKIIRGEHKEESIYLQKELNEYLQGEQSPSFAKLVNRIKPEIEHLEFSAFEVSVAGEKQLIGDIPQIHEIIHLQLELPAALIKNGVKTGELTIYHASFRRLALKESTNLIIGVVASILFFGIFLTWTINNSLSKPFQNLINATQLVSQGNLDIQLDTDRGDEFGQLSGFFNEMVTVLKEQQQKLLSANESLKTENEVRLEAEKSLIIYRDHLEKTVEQRTADLEVARDQALLANQAKSAFIANMSHEMRTPLTAIIGFGDFILNDAFTMEDRKNAAQTVSRNGHHLLTIINDILDMSKIEAGKMEIEQIPISPFLLLSDVASLMNMKAHEKGLQLAIQYEYPLPSSIASDPTRIKQILLNLCANAVKFTTKGSVRIGVRCNVEKQQMEFRVMDTGIGLSVSAQQNLFGAFNQADSTTTRKFGGTGLGLFISKRLAQLLGGDIQVESEEGVGSTFTVTIDTGSLDDVPFIENEAEAGQIKAAPTIQLAKLNLQGKVLLAEDTLDNQRLISMYLRGAGITDITIVENGKLALEHALANVYDLILMDMQMPVMGGLEAVTLLRAAGCTQPIYALTANAMKEDQENYIAAGCTGFLSKPIDHLEFSLVLAGRLTSRLIEETETESAENTTTEEGEDEDEFEQMIRDFVAKLPTHRAALEEAFAKSDWDAAKSIAHKLKGIGGSFGFPEITRLATPLEASLKTGTMENVSVQHADLLAEIDRICTEGKVS